MPVRTSEDIPAALKIQWPHRESEQEAAALAAWDGRGAVRLLAHDATLHALVLERCEPGDTLAVETLDAAITAMGDVLEHLAVLVERGPFTTLAEEAGTWHDGLTRQWEAAGRPFERTLLARVIELLEHLPATQGPQVLVHQDLHSDNVLRSQRGWLATDPKPLIGEVEFSLAGFLRSFDYWDRSGGRPTAFGGLHDASSVRRRLDATSERLGLDRDRARHWAAVQLVAWCFDSSWRELHVECARWLLDC